MSPNAPCPTEDRLAAWSTGRMLPSDLEALERHVPACPRCRQILTDSDSRDPLASRLRGLRAPDAYHGEYARRHPIRSGAGAAGSYWPPLPASDGMDSGIPDFLAPPTEPDSLGRLGRYHVLGLLGTGGMGIVFKARDPDLDRIVAVKVMKPELARSPDAHRRFVREARAGAAVKHDNVVTIHAVEEAGLPYIVMEYVPDGSLQELIDRDGPLPADRVLDLGRQIAAGLAAAHERGLVHRDLKPANILLDEETGRAKITDFGLVRIDRDTSSAADLSIRGTLAGTPAYMSPEQALAKPLDARSDLFSLGSVLYAMCAGRPPFQADTHAVTLHAVAYEETPSIRQLNPDMPGFLIDVIDRLHAKGPDERYVSATEVADALIACTPKARTNATSPPRRSPTLW